MGKQNISCGGKCRIASAEILRSFIFWAYQRFNQENDVDQVFRIAMKGNPQLKIVFYNENCKICQSLVLTVQRNLLKNAKSSKGLTPL